jgi:hypothetical protein
MLIIADGTWNVPATFDSLGTMKADIMPMRYEFHESSTLSHIFFIYVAFVSICIDLRLVDEPIISCGRG